ncbi:MAG: hypothetical protein INQ03_10900 [Candidatus Heimdallarchaeota archaeon]|nr:hypothetical protein [Candidatus Heimdallarchaeota archaeon]
MISTLDREACNKIIIGKSIQKLLFHLYEVYWSWLHVMTDQDFADMPDDDWSCEKYLELIRSVRKEIYTFAESDSISKSTILQWEKNDIPFESPNLTIVMNFITHSAYHRGQLAILMHECGVDTIGETDINPYYYSKAQQ